MKTILWFIPLLVLAGCADSGTYGNSTERAYEDLVVIRDNSGEIELNVYLTGSSKTDSEQMQDTSNDAAISPRTSAGWNGGSGAMAMATDGAEMLIDRLSSSIEAWQDHRKSDSENTVSETTNKTTNEESAKEEVVEEDLTTGPEAVVDNDDVVVGYNFHHTQTNGTDGGQSLVMCPGEEKVFDSCAAGDVDIPYHGRDEGRLSYWNMREYSYESIVCKLDGVSYTFPVGEGMLNGNCN